ncbi:3-oxoacyl-ACP synthase III family protein [Marinigracilibium pacificum]|uniref:Ketoacyl-ACP synthase III n=1 Tax=Marinigracilibium pacificum TaxID=2729599 RepID=A0A848IYB3_9BACT|nr:ketoacyl-ACP synthase III [Marinigracilibium pacificum]NMM47280.1 ketoacyl-ACP synthase III [Marinigracilibium pacificum]
MRNAFIVGTGSYVPELTITNQYFNEKLGEDVDTWLVENLTIRERHWCKENESTADLCENAALAALAAAGISAPELDMIIVSTDTPEYISPSTASVVQHRIGATRAGTFDLNTACAGFVTALDTASKYIKADKQYNNILVIGAYAMSKHLNKEDKKTVTLFADGAGAVVLQSTTENKGFLSAHQFTCGEYHDWMGIYSGGARQPVTSDVITQKTHQLQFVKKFPKELNPTNWTEMAQRLMDENNLSPEDVKMFFMTQINISSIHQMLDNLNLPHDRAYYIMDKYGYTGSAAIPMALDEAVRNGNVKKGDIVFFIGSGGGLAFAAAAFKL